MKPNQVQQAIVIALNSKIYKIDSEAIGKIIGEDPREFKNTKKAINFLLDKNLFAFRHSACFLTTFAHDIIETHGTWQEYLNHLEKEKAKEEERKKLEEQKLKIDFELAKKMLKEYPTTKMRAKVSFIISIISLTIAILLAGLTLWQHLKL